MLMTVLDEESKKLSGIAPQLLKTAKLDSSSLAPRLSSCNSQTWWTRRYKL